ncbi:MAG: MFS transporter [Burkholderiales bacterium]|nr:MAG: MFS transporter [Burkholderiales bacterium]
MTSPGGSPQPGAQAAARAAVPSSRPLGALFFVHFALVGVLAPYLSLFLAARGLAVAQIGVLMTLPQVVRIFAPPLWGWMADHTGRHALLMRVSALVALAGMAGLAVAQSAGAFAVAIVTLFFATSAAVPIGETLALRAAAGDSGRYGRIRLWGSLGFLGAVASAGPLLDATGIASLPWWVLVVGCAIFGVSLLVKGGGAPAATHAAAAAIGARLRQPAVLAFFASAFLMIVAHMALYTLYSLYLERLGFSKTVIGGLWAVGVVAEVALFYWQRPLFQRFGAATLLSASFAVCALRFLMIYFAGDSLWWLLPAQLLHAVTFGVHHSASMQFLHRWFDGPTQSRAQALYIAVAYGLGGTAGGLLATVLWSQLAPAAIFLGASAAAALGWVAVAACRRLEYSRAGMGRYA